MCPGSRTEAASKASSRGEEVFANRCLCLKCPCVFRPRSIRAREHPLSLSQIYIAVTMLCKVRWVFKSFVGLKLWFIVLAAHAVIM